MTDKKTSTSGQLEGSLKLAGDTFEQAASRIHELHRAISDMPFKAVGVATASASKPVELIHNEVTDLVYDVVKTTGRGFFQGAAWLANRIGQQPVASPLVIDEALDGELTELAGEREWLPTLKGDGSAKRIAMISSALNGIIGDHLAVSRNAMAVKAGFYQNNQEVALSQAGLAAAFPNAQPNLVVFIHGLCCNEDAWRFYYREGDDATLPYGDKLARDYAITPLFLRYNTGLSIEANGRRFRRLLKRLLANWPVTPERLTLVGHSMGGLVARVAVQEVNDQDPNLNRCLKDVIALGTPHAGAPLARLAGKGEALFGATDLSKPIAKILGVRSTGIRDLQEGLGPLVTQNGLKVGFHWIGATMGDTTGSWFNETLGDGLVQMSSALADESGQAQRLAFAQKHHMNLLNDNEVYEQIEAVVRQHLKPKLHAQSLPNK